MTSPFAKPSEMSPGRIAPLAKLPVFLDLKDKPCLVVGRSQAAAWKAELLTAAGANVRAVDCEDWTTMDFEGMAVAIADLATDAEALRFATTARKAGVPVNVIDQPLYCDFQFGSIVNRSPVVVGISTDGGAPILGQAIRRRIEALLPSQLPEWGRAAKTLRARIAGLFPDRHQRRRVWGRFAEKALSGELYSEAQFDPQREVLALPSDRSPSFGGRVTLVGAGPGDAELLTVKAIRALQCADVILFDALVSDEVLDLARREAKRMLVGKRGRRSSCRQDDINSLMVKLAKQGKHVVRLKGGDPSIFGRSGEEIEHLDRHNIPFQIVPGITAASGAAARLGISLTHRDTAHSVRFVTGHGKDGQFSKNLDWDGLADPETSLIFYMAGRTAPDVARRLLDSGLSPLTPITAVAGATRPEEKVIRSTIGETSIRGLPNFKGPVLLGIGQVFQQVRMSSDDCSTDRAAVM
ncbi:MAG: uroporphyrinogen-III C-methyltransferase [Flavobacteriales bacterium TMED123]|nr:MAG: uroporphyrinogen-III C-methyltransferase [Flavobacteriales bacterium TMED123]